MALERETILLENLRESLNFYQRSLVWGMTAAAAFFFVTLSLDNSATLTVPVVYGEVSRPAAWGIAFGLYYVLGILAASFLKNVKVILLKLKEVEPEIAPDVLEAVLLYPSLATNISRSVRVGSALFPPTAIMIAFALRLYVEAGRGDGMKQETWWFLPLLMLLMALPYLYIAKRVWHPVSPEELPITLDSPK